MAYNEKIANVNGFFIHHIAMYMRTIAKIINGFKPFFYLLLALLDTGFPQLACAHAHTLFSVNDIHVDVSASNATQAKSLAITQGEYEAFYALLLKFFPTASIKDFPEFDKEEISAAIASYEVEDEEIAASRYRGILAFSFNTASIEVILAELAASGLTLYYPKSFDTHPPTQQPTMLVLPILYIDNIPSLWETNNTLLLQWHLHLDKWNTSLIKLPKGDKEDQLVVQLKKLWKDAYRTGNYTRLKDIADKYQASTIVIPEVQKLTSPHSTYQITLRTINFESTPTGPYKGKLSHLETYSLEFGEVELTQDDALTLVIEDIMMKLVDVDLLETTLPLKAHARIVFDSLRDWIYLQHLLDQATFIASYTPETIASDHADIAFEFVPSNEDILQLFSTLGFKTFKDGNDLLLEYESPHH